jgi:hypothetical protein
MLRLVMVALVCLNVSLNAHAQLKKFYTLKESNEYDTVDFILKASSGNSFIKNYADSPEPLVIYGNPDLERINPSFKTKYAGRTCYASLELDAFNSFSFGDGFSFVMAKKAKEEHGNYWKVLVNDKKIYRFYMKYGVGNTEVDLSNIKLHKLRLHTGSANVMIGYQEDKPNKIKMDTFSVKVDMGSLETQYLANSRAKCYVADIGFGTAKLDFRGNTDAKVQCNAKIGAGSLDVLVPNRNSPVIIYLKDSPFCGIRMADDFEEVEKNVWVNHSYSAKAGNLMTFNVDLALGTISFAYAE